MVTSTVGRALRNESLGIKKIIDTILDKLFSLNSDVDEDLVGMRTRLQGLKSGLKIGSGDVRMIGIWGMGGTGKTTLATSVFKEASDQFESHCIVDNIREESGKYGLVALQEKMLSAVSNERVEVRSVYEGIRMIKSRLCHRNVLILLDDVDHIEQLEALAGSAKWFGVGSRIIITTRDGHLLRSHKVDTIFTVSLLSPDEAIQLFNRHAYHTNKPVEDYDRLSLLVVSYVAGHPLSLKILGPFLYEKDKNEWLSTLDRLKNIPFSSAMENLKISYDALDSDKKQLFLDIACFLRREEENTAMRILDACYPGIAVKVLTEKAFITISNGKFDMHDLVQDLGHDIVTEEHPENPGKCSRIWRRYEIDDMCCENETTAYNKVEAIKYDGESSYFSDLVSKMKKLRFLWVSSFEFRGKTRYCKAPTYLSNELRYIHLSGYLASPLPENFQPTKLVVLNLDNSLQKELWEGYKQLPCLKELHLSDAHGLVRTPDFGGFPCLQKLTLKNCGKLEEIHTSLGNHKSIVYVSIHRCDKLRIFPTIIWMKNLETLEILDCNVLLEFPAIQATMDSLVSLSLINVGIKVLPSSIGKYCTNLISLKLEGCQQLESIENFHGLKHLQKLKFTGRAQLQRLSKDLLDEKSLEDLHVPQMRQPLYPSPRFIDNEVLSDIGELSNLQELHLSESYFSRFDVSLSQLTQLKLLNLTHCEELVEFPELPSSIAILITDSCYSLKVSGDFHKNYKWLSQVSLRKVRIVSDGDILLQSMLQGKAIENHSMSLCLHGLEIPMRFIPPLLKGTTCTLQLPENWCNHFCGFLMCAAVEEDYNNGQYITMKYEKGNSMNMDSQPLFWKEFYGGVTTWVGYVSFGSLRHTKWWEPRSTVISFSIKFSYTDPYKDRQYDTGFGVRLVPRRRESGPAETPATDSSSEFLDEKKDYAHKFKINRDSKSALEIVF